MPKTIVIGDIHGCYDELQQLLAEVDRKPENRLISVGDVITKGPENLRVFKFFQTRGNAEAVLGNHERILLQERKPSALRGPPALHVQEQGGWICSRCPILSFRSPSARYFIPSAGHRI